VSSAFRARLASPADDGARRWVYVPYDQLTDECGPLAETPPDELGIVMVESVAKAERRPYHRQKLALVLSNMRHFALEQASRGVAVDYRCVETSYAEALSDAVATHGPLEVMRPAERELRTELQSLIEAGALTELPHAGWLTTAEDFAAAREGPPWRMDAFYRYVRRRTGILMDGDRPEGGKYSFDSENRKAWRGDPPAPAPPAFAVDDITEEVGALVETRFADHPGTLDLETIPATRADAAAVWQWARRECLASFGPYQDAMSKESESLFHTRISALLHLHRLLPATVVQDVVAMELPLASREGFVRQVLGWREFVRHVHEATDGFSSLPPDVLDRTAALPPAFWGTPSGLACLDHIVADVWHSGYGHHITRLMVLSNIATLLDVDPRELTDWFWAAYTDAYDWVVEPNVLGMGTYAVGDLMTTKPYVSGAGYVDRMSDYCGGCAFHPKKNCPLTDLYWQFLARNHGRLTGNPRVAVPLSALARRPVARRRRDAHVLAQVRARLATGQPVKPQDLPDARR
jgi:deoxyribodipyrimidine photolyase-related protein